MGTEIFWIRLFCSEFDDPRWLAVEQMPDSDAVQIIYVRMLMLAGRSNANGLLFLHETLPYDFTTLSAVLRRSVPVIQFALMTLERFKFRPRESPIKNHHFFGHFMSVLRRLQ
jgi:predicted phage replisome organizer